MSLVFSNNGEDDYEFIKSNTEPLLNCPFCNLPPLEGPIVACVNDGCSLGDGHPQQPHGEWNDHIRRNNHLEPEEYAKKYRAYPVRLRKHDSKIKRFLKL